MKKIINNPQLASYLTQLEQIGINGIFLCDIIILIVNNLLGRE